MYFSGIATNSNTRNDTPSTIPTARTRPTGDFHTKWLLS